MFGHVFVHTDAMPTRRRPGPKLADLRSEQSEARRRQFIEAVAQGLTLDQACAQVKVQRNTYDKWRERWPEFRTQVDIARAAARETAKALDFDNLTHVEFVNHYFGMMHTDFQLVAIDAMETCRPGDIVLELWPPEHGKTTTFENYASDKLARNPNYRIAVASESTTISKKIIGRVKHRMEPGGPFPAYVRDWGPFRPQSQMDSKQLLVPQPWTAGYFNVFKKATHDERDYSMIALGWTSSIVSTRSDHLHADDLQSTKSLTATNRIESFLRQDAFTRTGETGINTVVGTRVGEDDIYERLEMDEGLADLMRVLRFPAIVTDPVTQAVRPLMPGKYTMEMLARMEKKVGPEAWARNYMQASGVTKESKTWTATHFERMLQPQLSLHHGPPRGAAMVLSLDPSLVNFNTVMACQFTPDRKLALRQIRESKNLGSNAAVIGEVRAVVEWCHTHGAHVTDLVIETMAFQRGLLLEPDLIALRDRWGFNVRAHLTDNNKYDDDIGIASMATTALRGRLLLPYADDPYTRAEVDELIRQMKRWKPGVRGNRARIDRLMALWFCWIVWQERHGYDVAVEDREEEPAVENTRAFKTRGLPYATTPSGLIVPTGAIR